MYLGHLKSTIRLNFFFLIINLSLLFMYQGNAQGKRENLVYFPNTPYELNIYKIYDMRPGKTLMLIGGIQGNEPGGFLSADLYADMSLSKGDLIVVPRVKKSLEFDYPHLQGGALRRIHGYRHRDFVIRLKT